MPRDINAEIEKILDEVNAKMKREDRAIEAARRLPTKPGRCPGVGLKAFSGGAYDYIVCPVCWAHRLGPWPSLTDSAAKWPRVPKHDRQLDA